MIRSLQQIIESEQSPTDEEWVRLLRCIDAWYEARIDRAAEYAQGKEWSGYILQTTIAEPKPSPTDARGWYRLYKMIIAGPRPTPEHVRGWYHQLRDSEGFEPGAMAKILCDLIRFAD